jgi:glycosyltransferase involved in cell wall biosynthesis
LPAISVVLPVHNGLPHLGEAIESVLAQSSGEFELVICNDGSDDGTDQVIASHAGDPRVRVCARREKSGVVAATNWAVAEARAPLVAIMHADDLCLVDRLERQAKLFAARPDCVLCGAPAEAIDWRGRPVHEPNLWRLVTPSEFAPIAHSSVMFRKSAFDAVGGYRAEAEYWEDLDLYWRLSQVGALLAMTAPVTVYRYSRISIRQRDSESRVERALETMYRCADEVARGRDRWSTHRTEKGRLHPRIFVARSWTRVWAGERATVLGSLLRRGRLGFDRQTLDSLCFVAWATIAPRTLRVVLRWLTRRRNRIARARLNGAQAVEWRPLRRDGGRDEAHAPGRAHALAAAE